MGIVVAARIKFVSNSATMFEWTVGLIAFKNLDAITSHGKKFVPINQKPLRTARPEACGNDFERIEKAIVVLVPETPNRIAVANEEAALAIEGDVIAPPGEFRACDLPNGKSCRQIE